MLNTFVTMFTIRFD